MGKNITIPAILSVFVFTILIGSSMSFADAAIYMKIEGIDGEATAQGHEKWIELNSFQFGVGRSVSDSGGGGGRSTSPPSFSEVVVTKDADSTSPKIFTETVVGAAKKIEIHFVQTSAGEQQTYMKYTLSNTLFSGYSVSSGGDRPSESLSLNFAKFEMEFIPFDEAGRAGTPVKAGYDLALGRTV